MHMDISDRSKGLSLGHGRKGRLGSSDSDAELFRRAELAAAELTLDRKGG